MFWKGKNISVEIWGSSHAAQIGARLCNFPHENVDISLLEEFLARRKANGKVYSTGRAEADTPNFVSGVENGQIVADTVEVVIANSNVRSDDYAQLLGKPRPSHADYAAYCKDGRLDFSGGGEFSGRMTAPLCVAGGIAKQFLQRRGITVEAYVASVGGVKGASYKTYNGPILRQQEFPSLSHGQEMLDCIAQAKAQGNSVGGVVECVVHNFPAGVGGALFDGLESKISYLLFAIPAVKGVEFGSGFDLSAMTGSQANDAWQTDGTKVFATTNNAGGINGGISNGMPLTLAVAFRPTPSIALPQQTVDLVSRTNTTITVTGRHDACIVPRAVPVVESAVALALLDVLTEE